MVFSMSTDFSLFLFPFFTLGFWSLALWSSWVRPDILPFKQRNYPKSDYRSDTNYHDLLVPSLNRAALGAKSHSLGPKSDLPTQNIARFKSKKEHSLKLAQDRKKELLKLIMLWVLEFMCFLLCLAQMRPLKSV